MVVYHHHVKMVAQVNLQQVVGLVAHADFSTRAPIVKHVISKKNLIFNLHFLSSLGDYWR